MALILYSYFRSSAAYRVRIALNLKGLDYEYAPVNLMPGVDGQKTEEYTALNPQGRVPFLIDGDFRLSQSPAILEYLDERYTQTRLMPTDTVDRARVRQLASLVACDIHPLNNLSVLGWIKGELGADDAAVSKWYQHWIREGFKAYEALISGNSGSFSIGDTPTLADVYLIPQVWNAQRFNTKLDDFPTIMGIYDKASSLEAFKKAAPEYQPDTPDT